MNSYDDAKPQKRLAQPEDHQGTTSTININKDERNLSTLGGILMLIVALMCPKKLGIVLGPLGANLLYRGITGHSLAYKLLGKNRAVHNDDAAISVPHEQGIRVVQSFTIDRPIEQVYSFWRDFTNLPKFMDHLESVTTSELNQSHWRVKGPAGTTIEWDAEIINEEANSVIGWRTLENPYVDHAGSVRFRQAPNNQGTEITVEMEYSPIGGKLGATVAAIFGQSPEQQIWNDLRRLKQYMEVGEIATVDGQPSGRA